MAPGGDARLELAGKPIEPRNQEFPKTASITPRGALSSRIDWRFAETCGTPIRCRAEKGAPSTEEVEGL